jgi:Ca-activated chloride channel family protein
MSTLRARQETRTLEARTESETPRTRLASAWILCDVNAPGRKEPAGPRRPVNVALVLDRSGSMSGRPLELARQGATLAVGALRDGDRFGVVTYDDRVEVVVPSAAATWEAKRLARERLESLSPGGSTDLHAGWLQGCEEVARGMTGGAESRCLLLTDGLANHGVTDPAEIAGHAAELLRRGIVTSTFGLGDGFDEVLLQRMAEAGGGNAYWVREPGQIGPAMEAEVGDSLEIVARGVELVVEGHGVDEVLVPGAGRLARGVDGRFRRPLGTLSAEQVRSETLHVRLRRRLPGRQSAVRVWLEDAEGALPREERELLFTFQPKAVAAAAPLDADVVVANRTAFVHGLVLKALKFDRHADSRRRIATLDREAARLAALEKRVPGLAPVLAELRAAAEQLSDRAFYLDAGRVKEAYHVASYALKGRDAAGRARYSSGAARLDVRIHGDGASLDEVVNDLSVRFRNAVRGRIPCRILPGEPVPPTGPPTAEMTRAEQRGAVFPLGHPLDGRPVTLLVTPRPLEGNRFSTWHDTARAAVVSTAGTDSRAPVAAFLAYEVVLHGLRVAWGEWSPETLMHEETRGCLFDFCRVRSDLDVKLHSATLCHGCRERLRRSRVDTGLVDTLLSVVSDLAAAGTAKVH